MNAYILIPLLILAVASITVGAIWLALKSSRATEVDAGKAEAKAASAQATGTANQVAAERADAIAKAAANHPSDGAVADKLREHSF